MESIWSKTAAMPRFRPLEGDRKTQVLIVGGGMAGLLCAYELGQAGIDYILAETGRICGGVTQNTTAKITAQFITGLFRNSAWKKQGCTFRPTWKP